MENLLIEQGGKSVSLFGSTHLCNLLKITTLLIYLALLFYLVPESNDHNSELPNEREDQNNRVGMEGRYFFFIYHMKNENMGEIFLICFEKNRKCGEIFFQKSC